MDKFILTKHLIQMVEEHAKSEEGELSIKSFANFLFQKTNEPSIDFEGFDGRERNTESHISQLIVMMYKYAKQYFKVVLDHTKVQTIDELVFLIILLFEGEKTKKDLIQQAIQEKTTGMEILKRLNNLGLVQTEENPMDKRSKLVKISEEGKHFMFQMFPRMDQVSQIVCGDLNQVEKFQFLELLNRLNHFHQPIFYQSKQKEILSIK